MTNFFRFIDNTFKKNDVVVCVDNASAEKLLTNGKKYKILAVSNEYVTVEDDMNLFTDFSPNRFKLA